ncbi:MAG: hypothetical protein ACRCYU_21475 [Nocardioides sp.]
MNYTSDNLGHGVAVASAILSTFAAIYTVISNRKSHEKIVLLENNLSRDRYLFQKLVEFRDAVWAIISEFNRDFLFLKIGGTRESESATREYIDKLAEQVGDITRLYNRYSYLFDEGDRSELAFLIEIRENEITHGVMETFEASNSFHEKLLDKIDHALRVRR